MHDITTHVAKVEVQGKVMAFKPNRELLNANFEGYKLAEDALPSFSKDLAVGVSVAKLKDEQFSYQHVRACSLHNHLVMDPEEDSSVYWYADDCTIQHARFELKVRIQNPCL